VHKRPPDGSNAPLMPHLERPACQIDRIGWNQA
jgi:hypothetical protein